jgi:hypothetical protein
MSKEDPKVRKVWPNDNQFDPSTKIHKSQKDYKRGSDNKQAIEDALAEAEDENTDLDFGY